MCNDIQRDGDIDLALAAGAVARLGFYESDETLSALAWAVRNRLADENMQASAHNAAPPSAQNVIDGLLIEAQDRPSRPAVRLNRAGRHFYVVESVWAGRIADPTGGARCFHHHLAAPSWATDMSPVGLYGRWLFYRDARKRSRKTASAFRPVVLSAKDRRPFA
ncbi:MAG: hypothetical protein AAGC95_14380 [Pseudomonadota bacterium]